MHMIGPGQLREARALRNMQEELQMASVLL